MLHETLQPTSAVQRVPRVCSALGRTCPGPVVGDAAPWKGVYPQGLVGWASPSPHTLPMVEAHGHGGTSQESGHGRGGGGDRLLREVKKTHYSITLLVRCERM